MIHTVRGRSEIEVKGEVYVELHARLLNTLNSFDHCW